MFIPYLQQEGIAAVAPPLLSVRQTSALNGIYQPQEGLAHAFSSNLAVFDLVHEGTLVHAVSVLSQWSSRLTVEVPAALLDWLKKAFTLKTSTSPVRHAYLQAMLGAFRGQSHDGHYTTRGLYGVLVPVLYSLSWFYCRRHSGPSLHLHPAVHANTGEGRGTKLPACPARRRRGGFCSFESTGTAGDTDR